MILKMSPLFSCTRVGMAVAAVRVMSKMVLKMQRAGVLAARILMVVAQLANVRRMIMLLLAKGAGPHRR